MYLGFLITLVKTRIIETLAQIISQDVFWKKLNFSILSTNQKIILSISNLYGKLETPTITQQKTQSNLASTSFSFEICPETRKSIIKSFTIHIVSLRLTMKSLYILIYFNRVDPQKKREVIAKHDNKEWTYGNYIKEVEPLFVFPFPSKETKEGKEFCLQMVVPVSENDKKSTKFSVKPEKTTTYASIMACIARRFPSA